MIINLVARNDQDAAASRAPLPGRDRSDRRLSGDAGRLHADGPDWGPDAAAAAPAAPGPGRRAPGAAAGPQPGPERQGPAEAYPQQAARRHRRGSCKWPKAAKRKAEEARCQSCCPQDQSRDRNANRGRNARCHNDKGASEDTKTDKKSGPGATPGTPEKDPKDKPETGGVGEDPNEDTTKNTPAAAQAAAHAEHHPQPGSGPQPSRPTRRRRLAGDPSRARSPRASPCRPRRLLTEQEKEAAGTGGDANAGVGPCRPRHAHHGPCRDHRGSGHRAPHAVPDGQSAAAEREQSTLAQGIWKGDEEDYDGRAPDARRTKDEYHRGDTIADGPDRDRARREKERDAQQRSPRHPSAATHRRRAGGSDAAEGERRMTQKLPLPLTAAMLAKANAAHEGKPRYYGRRGRRLARRRCRQRRRHRRGDAGHRQQPLRRHSRSTTTRSIRRPRARTWCRSCTPLRDIGKDYGTYNAGPYRSGTSSPASPTRTRPRSGAGGDEPEYGPRRWRHRCYHSGHRLHRARPLSRSAVRQQRRSWWWTPTPSRCNSPAKAAGSYDVRVTTPIGTSTVQSGAADNFIYT